MNASELIEELRKCNPQSEILIADWNGEVYEAINAVAVKPVYPLISADGEEWVQSTKLEEAFIIYPDARIAAAVK